MVSRPVRATGRYPVNHTRSGPMMTSSPPSPASSAPATL